MICRVKTLLAGLPMKSLLKIAIPLVLLIGAAIGNQAYLARKLTTEGYVAVNAPLKAGDGTRIEDSNLKEVRILVADGGVLNAVKYADRAILHGAPIRRDFEEGDLVLLSDVRAAKSDLNLGEDEVALLVSLSGVDVEPSLLRVGREIGFVVYEVDGEDGVSSAVGTMRQVELGPFRLISVGDDTELETAGDDRSRNLKINTISVAAKVGSDHVIPDEQRRLINAAKRKQILAVTLRKYQQSSGKVSVPTGG
jgi:hypothetical protein